MNHFVLAAIDFRLVALKAAILLATTIAHGEDTPVAIETLNRYRAALSSIRGFTADFNIELIDTEGKPYVYRQEYLWQDQYHALRNKTLEGDIKGWEATDGRLGYSTVFDSREPGFPAVITKSKSVMLPISGVPYTPLVWMGVAFLNTRTSISTRLDQIELPPRRHDQGDGAGLVRITVDKCPSALDETATAILDLSPEHDGLPVRWTINYDDDSQIGKRFREGWGEVALTVSEFRQVDDELSGEKRWIPWDMEISHKAGRFRLRVHAARWNPPLTPADILPKSEPATKLVDRTQPGVPIVSYPSRQAAHDRQQRLLHEAGRQTRETTNDDVSGKRLSTIEARPHTLAQIASRVLVVAGAGTLCLALAIVATRRWRRDS